MQKTFLKLSAVAMSMGLVAVANADVTVPSLQGGFNVALEANYLKPYGVDAAYGEQTTTVTKHEAGRTDSITTTNFFQNKAKFKMGYGVSIGYIFPNTANDIGLTYSRYRSTADSHAAWNNTTTDIYPNIQPSVKSEYLEAATRVKVKQDQWDLLLGQYINVGTNLQLHLKGGLSYAKLSTLGQSAKVEPVHVTTNEQAPDSAEKISFDQESHKFKGLGPTLGLDAVYSFGNTGFGLSTGLQASLLVGKQDTSHHSLSEISLVDTGEVIATSITNTEIPSKSVVVPALAAKLGLNYERNLNSAYKFGVEAGYQVKSYLNVFGSDDNNSANFSLAGPYANFKLTAC